VTPPSYRFDLTIEEDLIEEVTRLVGYDKIPAVPEYTVGKLGLATEACIDEDQIADALVARGYCEIISYSFIDADLGDLINPGTPPERLANPISKDLGVMRRSLWPGLLVAAAKNLSRQQQRLQLFEIGSQFEASGEEGAVECSVVAGLVCGKRWAEHWDMDDRDADFFDAKGDVESLISLMRRRDELRFAGAEHPALRPGRSARIMLGGSEVGWIGELHPAVKQQLELKQTPILFSLRMDQIRSANLPVYRPYSKFPSLRRDLAAVVAQEISVEQVLNCVTAAAGSCLQNVNVFDVYCGPGIDSSRKSIGLGLILQDTYRTLTDEDADRTVAAVVEHLGSELGATIRN
jgi:phenylalanyl-tRNA synthetase beta chain